MTNSLNIPIDTKILMKKTDNFARESGIENFEATPSWIQRWKTKNCIVFKKKHGKDKTKF